MGGDHELRRRIRQERETTRRRIVVLDDDPTGSQAVHDVQIVTTFERDDLAAALAEESTVFVLTNTRSMDTASAIELNRTVAARLFDIAAELGVELEIVSRSDSTLRGHVMAETTALQHVHEHTFGRGYDAILFVPCYIEAGRVTADDIHWVTMPTGRVPVAETEFARDATFGYSQSNLRDFLAEASGGGIDAGAVASISLADIRDGGAERVGELLAAAGGGGFVVVNATDESDLDTVALGVLHAQRAGHRFLYRTGPSFVRALAGLDPSEPLGVQQIWPEGRPANSGNGHGLVVVGSHTAVTTRQLDALVQRFGSTLVDVDVSRVVGAPGERHAYISELVDRVVAGLADHHVVLATSRHVVTGRDADDSLRIAREVSATVSAVVAASLVAHPAWIVAKGGITSHDVAVRGLGMRRARVVGQLGRGIISLFRPLVASPDAVGVPYVVFPGNVGDDQTLADVVATLRGPATWERSEL